MCVAVGVVVNMGLVEGVATNVGMCVSGCWCGCV